MTSRTATTSPMTIIPEMMKPLDSPVKRLRGLSPGELADEIGVLEARIGELKAEAVRRCLHRAEGQAFRIVLTPPGTQQRTDKPKLLASAWHNRRRIRRAVLPSGADRLAAPPRRKFAAAAWWQSTAITRPRTGRRCGVPR
jgi:hypothetical protein